MEEDLTTRKRTRKPSEDKDTNILQSMNELFNNGKTPAGRIFMKGEAGCGKTFLCLKLLDSWCRVKQSCIQSDDPLKQTLAMFDLVFFVPLRQASREGYL